MSTVVSYRSWLGPFVLWKCNKILNYFGNHGATRKANNHELDAMVGSTYSCGEKIPQTAMTTLERLEKPAVVSF